MIKTKNPFNSKLYFTFFSVVLLFSNLSFAQDWKWSGFEIIGNHKIAKEEILSQIPIKVGDVYKEDLNLWQQWCGKLKSQFKFHYSQCSSVRYINFQAYFVVEIVEDGYEYRNQFRPYPQKSIPFASQEILDLYERLYKRLWELFSKGVGVKESTDKGFLDFDDIEMHEIVEKLIKLTPAYRDNLLEVLEKDRNINKREKAANLLNWTINDLADSIISASRLLDDPSGLVRNNISRFTLHFVDKVKSQSERKGLIDKLLLQLDRPSHGDRNKAIYNLLYIGQRFPSDLRYIKDKGNLLIKYIAETSILENVRDPAVDLLKMLNDIGQ